MNNQNPPKRTASGGIGCPRCGTVLKKDKAPFYLHNEYVGIFDSLVCPICNYSALLEEGYDNAIKEAKNAGLIGIMEEMPEIANLELRISQFTLGESSPKKILATEDNDEGHTWDKGSFLSQKSITVGHFTKRRMIKVKPS